MRPQVTLLTLLVTLVITTDETGRPSLLPGEAHAASAAATTTTRAARAVVEAEPVEPARAEALLAQPIHKMVSHDALLDVSERVHFGADGGFDLIVHFHGGGAVLAPQLAALEAAPALLSVNLGVGSSRYAAGFVDPRALWHRVDAVVATLRSQVPNAKVRRLALSAWSAGYGALQQLLTRADVVERVDAVILADGLHASFIDDRRRIIADVTMAPFVAFAERAAAGDKMMLVTHSSIVTYDYASTTESSNHLVAALQLDTACEHVAPDSMAVTRCLERGGFKIVGYAGDDKQAHCDHLQQLGPLAIASLMTRWQR